MYKNYKRYQTLYSSNRKDERKYNIITEHCTLCLKDIQHQQNFFRYIKQDNLLCGECYQQLKRLNMKTKLENINLYILYEYNDFLENMIYQFKEGRDIALSRVFFHEDMKVINHLFHNYAIVLMPSSKEKMMERKFSPVKEMLKDCNLEIIEPFFKSENRKQSLQSYENRANITQVIHRRKDVVLPHKKLLLVDDVCTSGSTLKCAYQLLQEHTYKIEAFVLCANPLFVESCEKMGLYRKGKFSIL